MFGTPSFKITLKLTFNLGAIFLEVRLVGRRAECAGGILFDLVQRSTIFVINASKSINLFWGKWEFDAKCEYEYDAK